VGGSCSESRKARGLSELELQAAQPDSISYDAWQGEVVDAEQALPASTAPAIPVGIGVNSGDHEVL
jgi:hypothetical protein